MFHPDEAVRAAAFSEYGERQVAAEAYAHMLSGDAQLRVILTMKLAGEAIRPIPRRRR